MSFHTLITVEELARHINDPSWRIFDCRHDLARLDLGECWYQETHIPNAYFLHLDRDLSGPRTGGNGRHPLPDPAVLADTLSRHGVSNTVQVIAYDDAGAMYAGRLWWLMRWLGHDKVAVLDGGLPAWQRAGYPVTNQLPKRSAAAFEWHLREHPVDITYVLKHLESPDLILLDGRGADRFRGENETIDPIAGHIPGAINRPFRENLREDGHFKPAAQLRREFETLLRDQPVDHVVSYCGSGVTACHNLLALEIAGLPGGRLYPGSWSEWCSDEDRPMITPDRIKT